MSEIDTTEPMLFLTIDGTAVDIQWEDNAAVAELYALAQKNITVNTSAYGGFEQVGSLPQSFSRSDVQMTTQPGDIVLYSGNQLVIFFGSNSWSYTRLGHIEVAENRKQIHQKHRKQIKTDSWKHQKVRIHLTNQD